MKKYYLLLNLWILTFLCIGQKSPSLHDQTPKSNIQLIAPMLNKHNERKSIKSPSLESISPSYANPGQTLNVTITGSNTNFTLGSGTTISFSFEQPSSTIVNSYNVIDDFQLEANITIPSEIQNGIYDVFTSSNVDGSLELLSSFSIINPIIWSDDFSDPTTWVVRNGAETNPNGWTIDNNVDSWYFNSPINSSSDGNFAELTNGTYDDVTGGTCPAPENPYTLTTLNPIDVLSLAGTNRVLLSWQEYGARYNDLQQVLISTDSGNSWVEVANNLDYEVLSQANPNVAYDNPTIREINIGSYIAANPSNVMLRFSWTTNYPSQADNPNAWITYGWMVDDVKLSMLPNNEIINQYSYIYNEENFGAEYGRTPSSQLNDQWLIGSQVLNNGNEKQFDFVLDAEFINNENADTVNVQLLVSDTLFPDSSNAIQTTRTISFLNGIYEGNIIIQSNTDTIGGENFDNNSQKRNFQITESVYSLDGLGIHPSNLQSTSTLGPNNFTASQGPGILVCATMYNFRNRDTINSVRAYISSNTQANSEVILYIIDSTNFRNGAFENSLSQSDLYCVTEQDVSRGYIEIPVIGSPWQSENDEGCGEGQGTSSLAVEPGNYYAALEISTIAGGYNIAIIDDLTVGQPGWSSAIFLPGEGVYSNGNALAIRLNLGFLESTVGIDKITNDFTLYPNPSDGIINISFQKSKKRNITVRDLCGKIIDSKFLYSSTFLDLSNQKSGVYLIEISSEKEILIKKVTIQ
tara:strand:- start:4985 stop:7231 length:2247 start_codon:yes stop_codon:yes gene_type:complete